MTWLKKHCLAWNNKELCVLIISFYILFHETLNFENCPCISFYTKKKEKKNKLFELIFITCYLYYSFFLMKYVCFESCQFRPRSVFFLSWRLNKSKLRTVFVSATEHGSSASANSGQLPAPVHTLPSTSIQRTRPNFDWFRTFIKPRPYYDSSHWNYFRKSSMKEVLK